MTYGYTYSQPGEKAREAGIIQDRGDMRDRRDVFCCCNNLSFEEKMKKYLLAVSCLFAAFLGPFSGVLAAAALGGKEPNVYYNAISTVVFFLLSLILVVKPSLRIFIRLWLLAGLVWVLSGWYTYFRKEFNEMPQQWLVVTVAQTSVYVVLAFLPVFLTDPCSLAMFT